MIVIAVAVVVVAVLVVVLMVVIVVVIAVVVLFHLDRESEVNFSFKRKSLSQTLDELEGRDADRHEERKKWCRSRAGNEPRIYRSPSGGCGCSCCSKSFWRRASTTGFSYWVFLFIWLRQNRDKQRTRGHRNNIYYNSINAFLFQFFIEGLERLRAD